MYKTEILMAYGITDSALDLLSSYLIDRKKKWQVNGIPSQLRKIHYGFRRGRSSDLSYS